MRFCLCCGNSCPHGPAGSSGGGGGVGWGGKSPGGQVHPLSPPTYFVWLEKADEALAECSKEVLSGR